MKYQLIVCGGTFDLLHSGHEKFLQDILNVSDKVLLGITSNFYVSKYKIPDIEDFGIRKEEVEKYLKSINALDRFEIVPINSKYEPLLEIKFAPQVIAVTNETKNTAEELNIKRKELGLPELKILIIEMDKAQDGGVISSTRIRNGEINREGRLYVALDWTNKNLVLPGTLRSELQKPFGEVLKEIPSGLNPDKTVAIGDITTRKFNENKIGQFLSIVDFQVQRKRMFEKLPDLGFEKDLESVEVDNPAGSITYSLFIAIQNAFGSNDKKIILVNGEEDLAVLPVLLVAPLGFTIFYGQPNTGLVMVLVTEESKEKAFNLISKFQLS